MGMKPQQSLRPTLERSVSNTLSDVLSEYERIKIIKGNNNPAWSLFSDYSENSTIHGVKYLGERRRHWFEKVFWAVAFVIALYSCSDLIYKIYAKWQETPVIVSFAEKSTPVWSIPFPAITVCPEIKAKREFLKISENYLTTMLQSYPYDMDDETMDKLGAIAQVCEPHLFVHANLTTENTPNINCVNMLKEMSVTFNETIAVCRWRNEMFPCDELFTEILTEEGYCYTFNILNSTEIYKEGVQDDLNIEMKSDYEYKKWNLEEGYGGSADIDTYPRRVLGSGAKAGLNVVLGLQEKDLEYLCRGPVQGFKIILHIPGEIPRVGRHYFRVPLKQEVLVAVKPQMITTSHTLNQYRSDRRQCFFDKEKHLKYFKFYTQSNCELECLTNYTLQYCGCVKFSMPRENGTRVCSQQEVACYSRAEDELYKKELVESLDTTTDENKMGSTNCNCLPSCTSITYDAEISQADFDYVSLFKAYNSTGEELVGLNLARLTIFFKEVQFITSRRSELYGQNDFLANVGGLLGLFMGFSILSLIEIIYYVTIRLACNLNLTRIYRHKVRRLSSTPSDIPEIKINAKAE